MDKKEADKIIAKYTGYGLVAGVIFGTTTDNLGLWLAIGIALGAGLGYSQIEKANKQAEQSTEEKEDEA